MIQKTFLKFFPPPQFLLVPYAGLAISDSAVRGFLFNKQGDYITISRYIEKPLPPGAVVGGIVQNKDEVLHILEQIKKETGFTSIKVSLPEETGYLFKTETPVVDPKEVRGAIEFKLEENVPLPADQVVFDHQVVGDGIHNNHLDVVVSVLPNTIVDSYVDLFTEAGFMIRSLEIESQALARSVISRSAKNACLIVNIFSDKVGLYIVYKGIIHFTSTVPLLSQAEDNLQSISTEIRKIITFWNSNKDADTADYAIDEICVCGEHVEDSTVSFLATQIKLPTHKANVWVNAFDVYTRIPEISFEDSMRFATVIGLALPSHILF
jgi:Tfp pilus assembly PilM family ATPase